MDLQQKNNKAIEDAINYLSKKIEAQETRIIFLERTINTLRAEIATSQQLAAHLSGRGMGSTVHG